jgi:uncharacterized protein DUF6519
VKGDFSRETFARKNHYSSVRMQQGRVQLDADWNEQADIVAHRERITTRDIIGGCGGPLKNAAFEVKLLARRVELPATEVGGRPEVAVAVLSKAKETVKLGAAADDERRVINASGVAPIRPPRKGITKAGDFILGAGRYYVDGILCENEQDVRFSEQPDFPEATTLGDAPFDVEALYLLYLDVWQRHLTALDDPHIRETALGGPDTATRTKTIWQAKLWQVPKTGGVVCPDVFGAFMRAEGNRNKGLLNASSAPEDAGSNPCIVPPSAGFRGLENLLYRVEIHAGGTAADVSTNAGSLVVSSFDNTARNQLKLDAGPAPKIGAAVELYPSKAGNDPLAGRLYFVTAVNGLTLTLNQDIQGLEMTQQPRLRVSAGTFKWSRQNGVVVTKIENISSEDNKQITVQSLGPDDDLGFSDGDWVELSDDVTELGGEPGQLTQIVTADNATRVVVLKDAPTVIVSRNAKMRRWDGIGPIRSNPSDAERNWITLENGLRIQFSLKGVEASKPGRYATGDYWLIPTRTATADRESGQIEWPLDTTGKPQPQPPAGIEHHFCPLALLEWSRRDGVSITGDCRRLFPPVTELTTLHYVSGTGQEATPVLAPPPQSLVELLHPLVVGVSNGGVPVEGARVVFEVAEGEINAALPEVSSEFPNGRLSAVSGDNALRISNTKIEVRTDADGLASCKWELSTSRWNQQVIATLLGPDQRTPIHLPVRFTANLSIAREVAYEPGACDKLAGIKTVQEALDELCRLVGLVNEPGIHVKDISFGAQARGGGDRPPLPSGVRPDLLSLSRDGNIENDFDLTCDALAAGLRVTCDADISPFSINGKPNCFVTLELPYPFGQTEKDDWGLKPTDPFFGFQSIILDGAASAEGVIISWSPSEFTAEWLRRALSELLSVFRRSGNNSQRQGRVLARLTLKGNFIWSRTDPTLYLDGELFGVAEAKGNVIAARSPSGDGRRGGDLELWFWLIEFKVALDKSDLALNETTRGVVTLSGPAPPQGATVQLSINDTAIAKLVRTSVIFKGGETEGAFEVTALKQGQAVISASYAGGERQVTVKVASAPPPRVKAVRIYRWQMTPGTEVLKEMNPSTQLPEGHVLIVQQVQTPNAIEVEFADDALVNLAGITTKNFVVQARPNGTLIPGSIISDPTPNAALWRAGTVLAPGDYDVILISDGTSNSIASDKGKRLDGDPKQLPSGDGQEGGSFQFILRVQQFVQPTTPLLKVKGVRLISRATVETVIFEAKEGTFNNTFPVQVNSRLNAIEIEFTGGPVNKDTVRLDQTFLVRKLVSDLPQPQGGQLEWRSDSVVRWTSGLTAAPGQPLTQGTYSVALLAGIDPVTNKPVSVKVASTDGRGLDGEPTKLPSGNNTADGSFFFTIVVV